VLQTKMPTLVDGVCDSCDAVDGDRREFAEMMFTILLAEVTIGAASLGLDEDCLLNLCKHGLRYARGEVGRRMKEAGHGK
jgi:hypothetical protein